MSRRTLGLLGLTLALVVWVTVRFGAERLERVPPITVTDITGEKIHLERLQNKPALITFWATTCRYCMDEIPALVKLHERFAPQGFKLIAIAMHYDPPNQVLAVARERNLPYHVALDPVGAAARAFGNINVTPTTFLIAADGRVVEQKVGMFNADAMGRRVAELLAAR